MANLIRPILGACACWMICSMALGQAIIERADLGIGNRYKVGSWTPLRLTISSQEKLTARVTVKVPDNDGVYTSISTNPFSLASGQTKSVVLLVRIGQLDSPINVSLVNLETGKEIFRSEYSPTEIAENKNIAAGEPATTRMIVEVSPTRLGVKSPEADQSNNEWFTQDLIARVTDLTQLPIDSDAYEAVDTVLVSTSRREDWAGLLPDDPRIRALVNWVRFGGRIILFCGENADLVLATDGPLAELSPGVFDELVTVDSLSDLESYTDGNDPLPNRARIKRSVPSFVSVEGDVELLLGDRERRLPAVVRRRHGMGEVVFVGLDVDTPPLREWPGRPRLVSKLLAYDSEKIDQDIANYYYNGPADISLALQEQLDKQLETSGIRTPPFLAIAGLVFLYILLIGPGDYLLVKHVLKKMELTWITFPLIVLLTCASAYWYANYLKGDSLRINQLEIVDIDNDSGITRGTMWTHIFSPSPDRYNLTPSTKSPTGEPDSPVSSQIAWLGRPAEGMGGMANKAGALPGRSNYGWSPDRQLLSGVPIEVWSTRTFVSRWESQTSDRLESDLTSTANDLLVGTVKNPSSLKLMDCRLIYGNWSWQVGNLEPDETVEIEPTGIGNTSSAPKKLRNRFKQYYGVDLGSASYYENQQMVAQLGLRGLAEVMMFYDALGGRKTGQWHRYQHHVDLSHALDSNTAMLVGICNDPRSELVRVKADNAIESMRGERDSYVVLYRYLLPVNSEEAGD